MFYSKNKIVMSKKILLIVSMVSVVIFTATAQRKPNDPKHENHYMVNNIETDDLRIEFKNAHSQQGFTQANFNITNKSNNYILVKAGEMKFKYAHGTYSPKGSTLNKINFTLDPMSSESKLIKVTGDNRFHVDSLEVELNGFYSINPKGQVLKAPDFQLPAAKNDFTAGACTCMLQKSKQTTKESFASFACVYTGKKAAFIDPRKLSVKLRDGQEFANNNRKDKCEILMPGDEITFTAIFNIPGKIADMQFSVLNINWNDTFVETEVKPLNLGTVEFKYDSGVTLLKNR